MREIFKDITGFDWDDGNRDKNRLKHNVLNGECEDVFFNQPLVIVDDTRHSEDEKRSAAFGVTDSGRRLIVIFTQRENLIRVISARNMHNKERKFYEKHS
jgi:uncharacterized DUF497 family protein